MNYRKSEEEDEDEGKAGQGLTLKIRAPASGAWVSNLDVNE